MRREQPALMHFNKQVVLLNGLKSFAAGLRPSVLRTQSASKTGACPQDI